MKELLADWKLLLMIGGGSLAALALIAYAFARPAANPEAEERKLLVEEILGARAASKPLPARTALEDLRALRGRLP